MADHGGLVDTLSEEVKTAETRVTDESFLNLSIRDTNFQFGIHAGLLGAHQSGVLTAHAGARRDCTVGSVFREDRKDPIADVFDNATSLGHHAFAADPIERVHEVEQRTRKHELKP